jgi:hypothetical protein
LACYSLPLFLRIPNQLFLLAIDGNDRLSFGFKSLANAIDVPKLAIPVGMQFTLNALLGGFEGKCLHSSSISHPFGYFISVCIPRWK